MECPNCGAENPEILADHRYDINYDEEQEQWVKEEGHVEYACGNCLGELDTSDIADVLAQVDEL